MFGVNQLLFFFAYLLADLYNLIRKSAVTLMYHKYFPAHPSDHNALLSDTVNSAADSLSCMRYSRVVPDNVC